jgi:hypothetical protein
MGSMSLRRLGLLVALPTVVGLSLTACGTEDDAAPGPPAGGSGATAGAGTAGEGATAGNGGTGAVAGGSGASGSAGEAGEGPGGAGGEAGDTAGGAGGEAGDGSAGDGNFAGAGGEGGQAPVVPQCPKVIFNLDADPGGSMGKYLTPATGPVQSSTVEWSSTDGIGASGAGKLNATFGAFGEQAQLSLYLAANTVWTCTTKLHAKVKLQSATDLSAINGIAFSINSGPYDSTGRYASQFTSTSTYAVDTWYSIELPFATAGYQSPPNTPPLFTDVRGIGIMVQTKSTGTTPTPVTLFVDDVWVE